MTKPVDSSALEQLRAQLDQLSEAEAQVALSALERQRDLTKVMRYVSGKQQLDVQKLIAEKGYTGTDHAEIARLAKEMDIRESVDELLALLDE